MILKMTLYVNHFYFITIFLSSYILICNGFEEKYSSLNETCTLCECYELDFNISIINCTAKDIKYLPAMWPSNRKLILSFNDNPILKLSQLAHSSADTISLSLANCSLEEISSAAFIDTKNLSYLDLSWNLLTGTSLHSDIFRGRFSKTEYEPLRKLKTLDLSYNLIHSLNRRIFEHIPNLKTLSLKGNPLKLLTDPTVLALQSIHKLEYLDLSSANLKNTRDAFTNTKRLRHLVLNNNSLVSVPESIAADKDSLKYLDISNNLIPLLNDESFLGLSNLIVLKISDMKLLTNIHARSFASLGKLKILNCTNNPKLAEIDDLVVEDLNEQWPMKEIYLQNNLLSEIPATLISAKSISIINLSRNPWFCNCKLYRTVQNISSSAYIEDRHLTNCYGPSFLYGTSIFDLPPSVCENNRNDSSAQKFENFHIQRIFFALFGVTLSIMIIVVGVITIHKLKLTYMKKNQFSPVKYVIATPLDYR